MADYFYTKHGEGRRRGAGWRDSRPFALLANDLRDARPGDRFAIGFPNFGENPVDWTGANLVVQRSGAPGRPIRIEAGYGVGQAELRAARGAGGAFFLAPNSMRARVGAPLRINGASYVEVSGLRVDGASADGVIKFGPGASNNVALRGFSVRNAGRAIETDRGAQIRNLLVEDCDAFALSRGFARFWQLDQSVLRNLTLDANRVDLGGGNVTQLIAVAAGSEVRFENIQFRNAVNTRDYVQGDGLVCERGTRRFVVRNCHAEGMGDGGFDLKTTDVTVEDCTAAACKYGLRIWSMGRNVVRRCVIRDPRRYGAQSGACVEAHGRAEFTDCQFEAGAGAAIFRLSTGGEGPPALRVTGGAIRLENGAELVSGDREGGVELVNVAVNGHARSGHFSAGQRLGG
ncbi:MAG TPA: right-handed parallel beta-helix repeat-containing protein [Caulobacterales bacterium]|nr:right-handed parallel beta-helix repeat-containing protein [Caulobacterales bacterium]